MVCKVTAFVDEIIVNLQCGLRRNLSKKDSKFCYRQIVGNEMWQSGEELQIFTDFKKACESVAGAVIFSIPFSFVFPRNCLV